MLGKRYRPHFENDSDGSHYGFGSDLDSRAMFGEAGRHRTEVVGVRRE